MYTVDNCSTFIVKWLALQFVKYMYYMLKSIVSNLMYNNKKIADCKQEKKHLNKSF